MQHLLRSALKVSKRPKRVQRNNSSLFLISIGLIIFIFGGVNYYRVRVLSFTKPLAESTNQKGELPTQITIPSINIDLNVEVGQIKDGVWQISYDKPTFLNSSARPGTGGNIVIYGHNKKAIFGNLPYLSIGQDIFVKTADNKIHKYQVTQKDFVSPDRVDLLNPTNKEELTIYTCWGIFDTQRVVVKAKLI